MLFKKSCLSQITKFLLLFFSWSFIVLTFKFKLEISFELNFYIWSEVMREVYLSYIRVTDHYNVIY